VFIVRALIIDDSRVIRTVLKQHLLRAQFEVEEAVDGIDGLNRLRAMQRPDVILVDWNMPQMNGLVVTEVLHRELPKVKVLILSMHGNTDYVLRIIQSGARGFILKEAPAEELVRAIEIVQSGDAYFSPDVARVALNRFVQTGNRAQDEMPLTNREREVLTFIADGFSNKEIACQLGVGVRTVETHRERIMRKLDIHTIAGLTRYALSKGLVSLTQQLAHA